MSAAGNSKYYPRGHLKLVGVKCFHFDPVTGDPKDDHDMNHPTCHFVHPVDGESWEAARTPQWAKRRFSEISSGNPWVESSPQSTQDKGWGGRAHSKSSKPYSHSRRSRSPHRHVRHRSRTPPRGHSPSPSRTTSSRPRHVRSPSPPYPHSHSRVPSRSSLPRPHSPLRSVTPPGGSGSIPHSPLLPPSSRNRSPPTNRVPIAPRAYVRSSDDRPSTPDTSSASLFTRPLSRNASIDGDGVNAHASIHRNGHKPNTKSLRRSSHENSSAPSPLSTSLTDSSKRISSDPTRTMTSSMAPPVEPIDTSKTVESSTQPHGSESNNSELRWKRLSLVPIDTSKDERLSRRSSQTTPVTATNEQKERSMMDFIKLVISLDNPITRIKEKQDEIACITSWLNRRGQDASEVSKNPQIIALREGVIKDSLLIQSRVSDAAMQNKTSIGDAADSTSKVRPAIADSQSRTDLLEKARILGAKFEEVVQLRRTGKHPLQDQRDADQKAFRDEVEEALIGVRKALDELYDKCTDTEALVTEAATSLSEELHERFSNRLVWTRESGPSKVTLEKEARALFAEVEQETKCQQEEFKALLERLAILEKEKQELHKEEQGYKEILSKSFQDLHTMKEGLTALVQNRGIVPSTSPLSSGTRVKANENASIIGTMTDDIIRSIVEQQLKPLLGKALQSAREEYDNKSEVTLQRVVTSLSPTRELQRYLEEWQSQAITVTNPTPIRPAAGVPTAH